MPPASRPPPTPAPTRIRIRTGTEAAPTPDDTASAPRSAAATEIATAPANSEVAIADDASALGDGPALHDTLVPELGSGAVRLKVFGALKPTFGVVHRDTLSARDRWNYGATGSRIDLGMFAKVGGNVSALFYTAIGTGQDDQGKTIADVKLERALMQWQPVEGLNLAVGRDAVPLSAQSATPTTGRVFPDAIPLNATFVVPTDVGAQATYTSKYVTTSAGLWNGVAGDAMLAPGTTDQGLLYSLRVEATPLGKLGFDENQHDDDTLKIGIGGAATYRAATTFSPNGTEGMRTRDLRAGLSFRAAYQGLFVETELLRKQITDDLSSRPDIATGGYVQGSYRLHVDKVNVAPLFRAGVEKVRQMSAPAAGSSVEVGAAVIPFTTDRLVLVGLFSRIHEPDVDVEQRVTGQLRLQF